MAVLYDIDMVDRSLPRCGLYSVRLATISTSHQVLRHTAQNLPFPNISWHYNWQGDQTNFRYCQANQIISLEVISKSSFSSTCKMLKSLQYILWISLKLYFLKVEYSPAKLVWPPSLLITVRIEWWCWCNCNPETESSTMIGAEKQSVCWEMY